MEDLRVCESNLEHYLNNKSKLFLKLNKHPFDFKSKPTLFYFPMEKIAENIKKAKPQELPNPLLEFFNRRYSEDTSRKLTGINTQRSLSKPNLGNLSNVVTEGKKGNSLKKSQRYVNFMRPNTNNKKIKEHAQQKIFNHSANNQEMTSCVTSLHRSQEEDPYKLGSVLGENQRRREKIYNDLKKILKKVTT